MLLTKLHIPTSGKHLVHRRELFDKLNKVFNSKLALISAPAGFGKSTTVSDWIDHEHISAVWFSIDNYDNDVVTFLSYTIAALQGIDEKIGIGAMELLNSPNPPRPESVINMLINDVVTVKGNSVLVFDDFHLINNTEILSAFAYFLDYLPQNLHLILISRSDPTLPIAKLRSQQQVIELRSSDLSFTAQDIAILFNKNLKIKLSENNIKSLAQKTEGWIAGLQLAALSMQGQEDNSAFINAFAGNNRYIMDYLIEEVLKVQSNEIKEFLLKTSILEQYSASLCNAILDRTDAQTLIEELENHNMFVFPLDEERVWYRYHHLFADLLKQRLQQSYKTELETLHSKACSWFEENQMFDLAIEHAMQINDHKKCVVLLGKTAEELWANGNHDVLVKYGDLLPDELIMENAEFSLYYAWILIASGLISKAEPYLLSAKDVIYNGIKLLDNNSNEEQKLKHLLGKVSVALAYLYSHNETSEKTFGYCDTAMNNLPDNNTFWLSWAWFSYGVCYFSKGLLSSSVEAFTKAYNYGKKTDNIYLMSTIVIRMAENEQALGNYKLAYKRCADLLQFINDKGFAEITKVDNNYAAMYFIMGVSQFTWAQFDKAFENIKIAYTLSKGVKDIFIRVLSTVVYAFVLKELGDVESFNKMKELDELMEQDEVPMFLVWLHRGWKIYLLLDKNEVDEAQKLANSYGLNLSAEKTHINDSAYISYCRILFMQNKLDDAEKLITELYDLAQRAGRIERIIELKVLFAALYNYKEEEPKAIHFLMEAMKLAADQNLLSHFVFNVNHIKNILDKVLQIHATKKTDIPQEFINNLKKAIANKEQLNSIAPNAHLSNRELDTLKAMAEELSNQQIADKLFVSLNTVKTHLKNIYLKLEVDNRKKAIEKAKELNLI